ncbi:SCP-domain-containing protein [Basidiobolus meristosporus CBS 931.73]|uniref:SCP-domain-containing protein n=1 Tax=Basidiobolus meristosporus CBS 931.73 TaxID=1314790 RepID=A0A1Y1XVM0_9FUNG|nr:SCP-domain-containing protein [Basidiobolus meristosporus CBS 931.73]|eukprot:ORX89797.1 SCP-domain-containing protein [Basidiobolus meristosporus CBS 931.73]
MHLYIAVQVFIYFLFLGSAFGDPQQQLELVNAERKKSGAAPLALDKRLVECAQRHTDYQAQTRKMTHDEPGRPLEVRIEAVDVAWANIGENVAEGFEDDEKVMDSWMHSPGHRQNILNPQFTHLGVGFSEDGNYWTQVFAKITDKAVPYLVIGQVGISANVHGQPTSTSREDGKDMEVGGAIPIPLRGGLFGNKHSQHTGARHRPFHGQHKKRAKLNIRSIKTI